MSVAQQAIRARRKAKMDWRYQQNLKDAAKRLQRMKASVAAEQRRQQKAKAKG